MLIARIKTIYVAIIGMSTLGTALLFQELSLGVDRVHLLGKVPVWAFE